MGKVIKLPNGSELTEEQLTQLIQEQEAVKITEQVADGLMASYRKGEGMVLQIAIPLQMADLKQMIEPEHPLLPLLVAHMACEQVKQRAFNHLVMVCNTIAEKMGRPLPPPPGEPVAQAAPAEEIDPGQIGSGPTMEEIAAAAAMMVGGKVEMGGSLDVAKADGSKD